MSISAPLEGATRVKNDGTGFQSNQRFIEKILIMNNDEEEEFVFRSKITRKTRIWNIFSSDKYSPEFIAALREKFNERCKRQSTGQGFSQTGSTEDSKGILGKITAGLQSVSETINDIVRSLWIENFLTHLRPLLRNSPKKTFAARRGLDEATWPRMG